MSEIVKTMSDELAEVVGSSAAAVVRVEGRRRLPATGIVWSAEGLIVTANHVVERDEDIQVGLGEDRGVPAELVGRDPTTDLAALRVADVVLARPAWTKGEALKVGHLVLALGRPGVSVQATLGIVSALGESWRTASGGQIDRYLQTDVVMYPGFSGGPLIDMSGEVLGLNTSALRGVSLALPTATIERVLDSLTTHGRVRRGYLGVGLQPAQLPRSIAEELKQKSGLLILSVEPDSPADQGKLTLGDTILSLDGEATKRMDDLMSALSGERVGKSASMQILRGGEVLEMEVVVGERK